MSKKIKIVFILSLCLNIFFIGLMFGGARYFKPKRESSGLVKEFMIEHAEKIKQLNDEKSTALEILKQKEFNRDRYMIQLEKIKYLQGQIFMQFAVEMGEKLVEMPKEERDVIIERIESRRAKHNERQRMKFNQ